MENVDLQEIRTRLSTIPVLEGRIERLRTQICEAEKAVYAFEKKYEAETQDVERLEKESFSAFFLRLIGQYEGKLTKETQEQLAAKTAYDDACTRLYELQQERRELLERIGALKQEQRTYESVLAERRSALLQNTGSGAHARYMEIEAQLNELAHQNVETDEALRAANRVIATAESALSSLESAHGWATYDIWGGGGIISHVAKYDHIDAAEAQMSRLRSQIAALEDELKDVRLQTSISLQNISSTTRAVDFWFDNIFTDLNVRSMISENQEQLRSLCRKVQRAVDVLRENKGEIRAQTKRLEASREALLIE